MMLGWHEMQKNLFKLFPNRELPCFLIIILGGNEFQKETRPRRFYKISFNPFGFLNFLFPSYN